MEALLRVALDNPTYESDFFAAEQILDVCGSVRPCGDELCLSSEGGYTYALTTPGGGRHTHLLKAYAIHHLLCQYYKILWV